MNDQQITFDEIVERFNDTLEKAMTFIIFVRDKELQEEQIGVLTTMIDHIRSFKYQAIERKNESMANTFFGFHNLLNSVKSCIQMILHLKDNNHQEAWANFVDAQEYLNYAALVKDRLYGLEEYHQRLMAMEKCYFPHWTVFNSSGVIESIGDCNICRSAYGECEHIEGYLYSGIVCLRINRKIIRLDHASIVSNPKDKRCIITKISTDDGFMQDYMTLKILERNDKHEASNGMNMECILMSTKTLDIN